MNCKRYVGDFLLIAAAPTLFLVGLGVSRIIGGLRDDNRAAAQQSRAAQAAQYLESTLTGHLQGTTRRLSSLKQFTDVATGRSRPDNEDVLIALEAARRATDASLVYVLNASGLTVACTRYEGNKTLTGEDYSFRPYFREAIAGQPCVYPAVGVTTGLRGLYFSFPLQHGGDGDPAGVIVVKAGFDRIDEFLARQPHPVAITTADGIVIASNNPEWMYRAASPLPDSRRNELVASRQFADRPLAALPVQLDQTSVRLKDRQFAIVRHELSSLGWRMILLDEMRGDYPLTGSQRGLIMYGSGFVIFLLVSILLLQMNLMSRRRSAKALEAANRQLETSVQERTRELALTNVDLQQEIAEREQMQQALEHAKEAAETANRAKSEFLANMSHEIRTPMTAILGFTDILLDQEEGTGVSTDERLQAINTIKRNGEYLLTLINDILDLSKIEAGKLSVEHVRCSLRQILSEIAALIQVRADAKGVTFAAEFEGLVPDRIETDPIRLRQILVNVIANAVKFTDQGEVRVVTRHVRDTGLRSASPETATGNEEPTRDYESWIQFDVHDTGIGIEPNQCDKLFAPFSQADSSTTRKFGGTGLGLAISRRFAQLLGGDVTLVRSTPGIGSLFRIEIGIGPIGSIDDTLPSPLPAASATCNQGSPAASSRLPLADYRILLAEDCPDNQRLISHVLQKAGAAVMVVENGQLAVDQALAAAEEAPFDAILMDMQMPVMDGYEATAILRRRGYERPIIALTAHAMASDRSRCIEVGCNDYATKPINRQRLLDILCRYPSPCAIR